MPKKGEGHQNGLSDIERDILERWIESRKESGKTSERTQAKQRHLAYKLIHTLHEETGATLDTAMGEDFRTVASSLSDTVTQNSRQSLISQLKSMVRFIQRQRTVTGADTFLEDVKGGCPTKQNKGVLSIDEWEKILNAPMSAKERAYLAMLYDGYHRPHEPYILTWRDLKINQSGSIEYTFRYKTDFDRTIVQKPETTGILEMWRKESGHNYGDDALLFPTNAGTEAKSNIQVVRLFKRIGKYANPPKLTPGSIRNTAITHDVMSGLPLQYICMRAWGEAYNPMINIYTAANSAQMQNDQHAKNGKGIAKTEPIKPREIKSLRDCPACGKKNAMDGSFCIYCGANMDGQSSGVMAQMEERLTKQERLIEKLLQMQSIAEDDFPGIPVEIEGHVIRPRSKK